MPITSQHIVGQQVEAKKENNPKILSSQHASLFSGINKTNVPNTLTNKALDLSCARPTADIARADIM